MGNVVDGEHDPATGANGQGQGQTNQPVSKRMKRYTKEQKDLALKLIDEGKTYREVIILIDPELSTGTVSYWVKERNKLRAQNQEAIVFGKATPPPLTRYSQYR